MPEGHRFEATQALRQVLNAAVAWQLLDVNRARRGVANPLRRFPEKRPIATVVAGAVFTAAAPFPRGWRLNPQRAAPDSLCIGAGGAVGSALLSRRCNRDTHKGGSCEGL